ncbi:DNA adenine methylase [Enterobacter sp. kpr-6]|uniref:DNA adenine methylase n=1 Tax=Enterobacter sp. kpr-6 TaxID=1761782 RepID=UPI0008EB93F0|nr:DNA adenine methylase [Enterobacter sp. kpr-6]SFR13748.1 DNA adenine methylase [Enterobacter sp. kpr-6]
MAIKTPLKWVGSKARLMPRLRPHLPEGKRLVEPFAGSCAVMMNTEYEEYLIADVNPDLINLYQQIKEKPEAVIHHLGNMFLLKNTKAGYLNAREIFNAGQLYPLERAVFFLFLNRHCFNGLCRYNRNGLFNVPYGKYVNPYFPVTEIRAFAQKAQRATFVTAGYMQTLAMVRAGDVVYCDPPYLTESSNFTAYHGGGFTHLDHGKLARKLRKLAGEGVSVIASNSDIDTVHLLYAGFDLVRINAPRSVGAAATSQKTAAELIIKAPAGEGKAVVNV